MVERFDVAVIGAGIVGLAAARALASAGRRVLVLDRGAPCAEASGAAAGMLAPQIEAHAGDALLPLGLAARDRYAALAAECARAGHDVALFTGGITHVAFDTAREQALEKQLLAQRALGLDVEWLDAAALRRRHPGVGTAARGALLAPRDGCVNNVALGTALFADARRLGVTFAVDEVCDVASRQGRVTAVRGATTSHAADTIVLAAGAWACTIAGFPRAIPVEPVRGQMAAAPWPAGEPAAVLYGEAGYLLRRGAEALIGSTMEHTGFAKGTTDAGIGHLRREAAALLPVLAGVPFTRTWSGLRPMTPDGLPIIGRDPDLEGLVYATGHGRNGILLGPLTGEIVRDLVVRGDTPWDISPYSITRFDL
jgi:glycine oxidase